MPIRSLVESDIEPLKTILEQTDVFREDEIEVAVELMELVVSDPKQEDYMIYTSLEENGTVDGYYCIGPTPMTQGTYDLYWIATDPRKHRRGVGRQLMEHCEKLIRKQQGRKIVVETSSQPKYEPTRQFYLRRGYLEEARLKDYYAPGDDLVIYTKQLQEAS